MACAGEFCEGEEGEISVSDRVVVTEGEIDHIIADGLISEVFPDRAAFLLEIPTQSDPNTGEFRVVLVNVNGSTELFRGSFPIRFEDLLIGDEATLRAPLRVRMRTPTSGPSWLSLPQLGNQKSRIRRDWGLRRNNYYRAHRPF